MLDLYKLMPQIEALGKESLAQQDKAALVAQSAQKLFHKLKEKDDQTLARLKSNQGLPLWPIALPIEPFASQHKLTTSNKEITVIGVDGSQIMPSQHEIFYCYLLNIGIVQIDYTGHTKPILTNIPYLFHKTEELYPLLDRRRLHVDELYVALERNLMELDTLSKQAIQARSEGMKVLALVDGSLLPWSLERMPLTYQTQYSQRMTAIFDNIKANGVSLFGYISNSRSAEVVNSMRILICPYDESNCKDNCRDLNEDNFPCSAISPLSDRQLFSIELPNSSRSAVFLSSSKMSKALPTELQMCFFYCNFAGDISRIECPRWLLEDKDNFDLSLAALFAQLHRGGGYPVVLAEAHHQAVIKNADREQFFDLLAKHFVSAGNKQLSQSVKALKKRISAV